MTQENIKQQLLNNIDNIVEAIASDKIIELKKERDNVQIFSLNRKKLIKTN